MGCCQSSNPTHQSFRTATKIDFVWDQTPKQAKNFKIQGKKVTKINEDIYYQMTGKHPLPLHSIIKFRLIYGKRTSIGFGLITQNRKNAQSSGKREDKQSIGYWSWPFQQKGYINADGRQIKASDTSLFVQYGGTIVMETNLNTNKLAFSNLQNNFNITIDISSQYKNRKIYAFVVMKSKDDSVHLVIKTSHKIKQKQIQNEQLQDQIH